MNTLSNLIILATLPVISFALTNIANTQKYKPCIPSSNTTLCPQNQACFQYFCFPKEASLNDPLKSCDRPSDCKSLGESMKCYKQSPILGICVPSKDNEMCESHQQCEGRGDRCCGDYCCNKPYFETFMNITCTSGDEVCKVISFMILEP